MAGKKPAKREAKKPRKAAMKKAQMVAPPGNGEKCSCASPSFSKNASNLCTRCGLLR